MAVKSSNTNSSNGGASYNTLNKTMANTNTMGGTAALEVMKRVNQNPTSTITTTQPTTTKTNSGSSKNNTSSATQTTAPVETQALGGGFDYAGMIQSMLEQQRAAAENAFNNSKARLDQALGDTKNALSDNLASTLNQLQRQYDYGSDVMNNDADKSLREAYVNYMLNKKNINQNLSAAGVSGGATESSLAKLFNNYGNSRNNINTTLAENLAELLNQYQNNTANANQAYNSQYADMMNNYVSNLNALESALASNLMSSYSGSSLSSLANYASTLNGLTNSMNNAAQTYTPTTNTLGIDNVNSQQSNDMGTVTDYAKYLAMVENMKNQGMSQTNMIQNLYNAGASAKDVLKVLSGN